MDKYKDSTSAEEVVVYSSMSKEEALDQLPSDESYNSENRDWTKKFNNDQALSEDAIVGEEDTLDAEVRDCLVGLPACRSDDEQSACPSSCSFYSSCTVPGMERDMDSLSTSSFYSTGTLRDTDTDTASFYSTGTLRDTDTDTASYCSLDTLRGSQGEAHEEEEYNGEVEDGKEKDREQDRDQDRDQDSIHTLCRNNSVVENIDFRNNWHSMEGVPDLRDDDLPYVDNPDNNDFKDQSPPNTDHPDLSYSRPSHLAGSTVSESTGRRPSLDSEGEVSLAGQVNDRLGKLLGYVGEGAGSVDIESALATIIGYEIVMKDTDKYTVYKIRVSCPNTILGTWFIHRRYSDFLQLRRTLFKENSQSTSQFSFPPKRWVGSNFEPAFLGRRLGALQVFLASVQEIKYLKSSSALLSFLSLDNPPVGLNGLEENRAICDTLEEAVKELRDQLRKREGMEMELAYQKNMNFEKDQQIHHLSQENLLLRKQKESLMNTLSSQRKAASLRSLADLRPSGIGTLADFTAKFNLKSTEDPLACSTPCAGDTQLQLGTRRQSYSQ
eukprot:GFUD01049451.1.p1 GENE.GFUD01049451.1~~GFUD01049451.1.p1  ORF type:complete len:553 (+),score=166.10 GFUD01049451.1:297-1955(+)